MTRTEHTVIRTRKELLKLRVRLWAEGALSTLKRLGKNKSAVVGAVVVTVIVVSAVFAPVIAPYAPDEMSLADRFSAPGGSYALGADHLGRDVLTRILYGRAHV